MKAEQGKLRKDGSVLNGTLEALTDPLGNEDSQNVADGVFEISEEYNEFLHGPIGNSAPSNSATQQIKGVSLLYSRLGTNFYADVVYKFFIISLRSSEDRIPGIL